MLDSTVQCVVGLSVVSGGDSYADKKIIYMLKPERAIHRTRWWPRRGDTVSSRLPEYFEVPPPGVPEQSPWAAAHDLALDLRNAARASSQRLCAPARAPRPSWRPGGARTTRMRPSGTASNTAPEPTGWRGVATSAQRWPVPEKRDP